MNLSVLALIVFAAFISAQDVKVPGDLLDVSKNSTGKEPEPANDTTTISPPAGNLIDQRRPNPPIAVNPLPDQQTLCQPSIVPPFVFHHSNIEPFERELVKSCPIGKYQRGNECVDNNNFECPAGFESRNERCVLSQKSCPLNFEMVQGSCVQRRLCPNNYVWKNDRCVLPEPNCPIGWRWNGETCVVQSVQCDRGLVLRGNMCVDETFYCPPNFDKVGDRCERRPPICYQGTTLDSNGFCVREIVRCPIGSVLIDGLCRRSVQCPRGSYFSGGLCYRYPDTVTTTARPIIPWPLPTPNPTPIPNPNQRVTCPEGFTYQNNMCYRCPPNYNLYGTQCVRQTCNQPNMNYPPQSNIPPNININIRDSGPSSRPAPTPNINIVNNFEPMNNTIINYNNITNPVTLNNVNTNNVHIYTPTQCRDGTIRTVIQKNNETMNACTDVEDDEPIEEEVTTKKKCCEIVTPRQCQQRNETGWTCSHKRYKYCGKFCVAERIYLKPPTTSYIDDVLTFAPPIPMPRVMPCVGRSCAAVDCSGCMNGSYSCSPQCFTYPCASSGCTYLDQDDFCGTVGGSICEYGH